MKAASVEKGKRRYYACPRCGDTHPSVTTILDVIASPALMGWMAKNGTAKLDVYHQAVTEKLPDESIQAIDKIAEQRWLLANKTAFWKSGRQQGEEAADAGTQAHAWIEAHLRGTPIDVEVLCLPAQNAIGEYLFWEKEHELETIKTEETFYNCKLNYAGTADWSGKLDGELSLGDWKTSTGIYFNYVVQGWGYVLADEAQHGSRLYPQIFVGRFGKDGSQEVKIFKRNEFPSIDTARDILIACGHIFKGIQDWEDRFPYKRKPKETLKS